MARIAFVILAMSFGGLTPTVARAQVTVLPPDENRTLVVEKCTTCHTPTQVVAQRRSVAQWAEVVDSMILEGAEVSDEEFYRIVAYLGRYFGPVEPGDPVPPPPEKGAR